MSAPLYFDDDGAPILAVDFHYGDEEAQADDLRAERLETVAGVLALLTDGATPEVAGRRALTFAYLVGALVPPCRTQRELAHRLGVSEARVSVRVKSLRAKLRALACG